MRDVITHSPIHANTPITRAAQHATRTVACQRNIGLTTPNNCSRKKNVVRVMYVKCVVDERTKEI